MDRHGSGVIQGRNVARFGELRSASVHTYIYAHMSVYVHMAVLN